MNKFSAHQDLESLSTELPSPLAVPVAQLSVQIEQRKWLEAFLAGMDAFLAGLKWTAFIGVSDVFQKLEEDHKFARRNTLDKIYPHIYRVLTPAPPHGHWVACVRAIIQSYNRNPEWFFVPEFMAHQRKTSDDPLKFEEKLGELVKFRNKHAHRDAALLSPGEAKRRWDEIDPFLGLMYSQLSALKDYHLVQFLAQPDPDDERPGWYRCRNYFDLKGYSMHERDILGKKPIQFFFGTKVPHLRRLYFLKPDYTGCLNLHPFVLFDLHGDLYSDGQQGSDGATFLFNELQENVLEYLPFHGREPLVLKSDDDSTAHVAGPIYQHFNSLRIITGGSDRERLHVLPGFPRRSRVINFNLIISFHTEAFAGRNEYFQQIEHLIAGPFRAVWIRGRAGYGKTAFLARLAKMHPRAIHYFISAEKGTANAGTFLLHVCQAIINRFNFPDVIQDDAASDLEELKGTFLSLLERANERLQEESEKLLIIIDGLDESERYATSDDEVIQKFLPEKLEQIPEKIFFVFSSRPDDVDLNPIVDNVIDLQPFSRNEVATILQFYNWDARASEIAYGKSGGQPLYFRFLIDGIKTNSLSSAYVDRLPEGITGFYDRFWKQCNTDKTQLAKKNPEKARLAGAMQHVLGFLATACEPLSATDLHELLLGLDGTINRKKITQAMLKENLGRFTIGAKRFSVFHDTLREYVLEATRTADDDLPFGEAVKYHEILAEWCGNARDTGYGDQYILYHLLHSRQYQLVVDLLEDDSENCLVRRRLAETGGTSQLVQELGYGNMAARELDSLDRIFHFSLMQVALKQQKSAGAVPEVAGLFKSLGKYQQLEKLFNECDEIEKEWRVAAAAYAHFLRGDDSTLRGQWLERLKRLWMKTESHSFSGLDKENALKILFAQMDSPTLAEVRDTISIFSGVNRSKLVSALITGLRASPSLVANAVAGLETRRDEFYFSTGIYEKELSKLAFILLNDHDHEELAWQLFSSLSAESQASNRTGNNFFFYYPAFLQRDPERALRSSDLPPADFDNWESIASILNFVRMTSRVDQDMVDSWIERQPLPVQAVANGCRAVHSAAEDDINRAEAYFIAECSHLSVVCSLACMTLLSLARRRQGREEDPWQDILLSVLSDVEKSADFMRLVEDDSDDMEDQMKALIPEAGKIMKEIGHLFADRKSAFWFSMAAATPALEMMADPAIQEWIRSKIEETGRGQLSAELKTVAEAVKQKLPEYLEYNSDRDDVQTLVLPVYFSFLDQPLFQDRIKNQAPLERPYSLGEKLPLLNPEFDIGILETLYPYMVDEDGDLIGAEDILKAKIIWTAFQKPEEAYRLWQDTILFDVEKAKEFRKAQGLDAALLAAKAEAADKDGDEFDGEEFDEDELSEEDTHSRMARELEGLDDLDDLEKLDDLDTLDDTDESADLDMFHDLDELKSLGDLDESHELGDTDEFDDSDDGLPSIDIPGEEGDQPRNVDAGELAILLLSSGFKKEAFEIAKKGMVSEEYWELFISACPELLPEFMRNIQDVKDSLYNYGGKGEVLSELISAALDVMRAEEGRDLLSKLLEESDNAQVVASGLRYVMCHEDPDMKQAIADTLTRICRDVASADTITGLIIHWIASTAEKDAEIAEHMLEEFLAFQAMQGLEFTSYLQESFDRMISNYLERNKPSHDALLSCAKSLNPDFQLARKAIALVMLKTGCDQQNIEPLLELPDARSISSIAGEMSGSTMPEWLAEKIAGRMIRLLDNEDDVSPLYAPAIILLAAPFWREDQRGEMLCCVKRRLEKEKHSAEGFSQYEHLLDNLQLLVDWFSTGEVDALVQAAAEDDSSLPGLMSQISDYDAKLSWSLLEQVPSPTVCGENAESIFENAIKTDLQWAVETFEKFITVQNAWGIIKHCVEHTTPEQWGLVENLVGKAADQLTDVTDGLNWDGEHVVQIIERSPALAAKIFRKTKYGLGWISFVCGNSRFSSDKTTLSVELFLELARHGLSAWKQAIKGLAPILNQKDFMDLDLDDLASYLGKLKGDETGQRVAGELLDTLEELIEQVERNKNDNIEDFLKVTAQSFPEWTLESLIRFNYRGIYLDDIIKSILDADPGLFPKIYGSVISSLDKYGRKRVITHAITKMSIEEALGWQVREEIDLEDYSLEYAKSGKMDAAELEQLLTLVGDDSSKHFEIYLSGLLGLGEEACNDRIERQEKAWEIFRAGEFTVDRFGDAEYRLPSNQLGAFSHMFNTEEKLGILFAAKPDEMEAVFNRTVKDASPDKQPKFDAYFDKIRGEAILPLFKINHKWILKQLPDWSNRPFWSKVLYRVELLDTVVELPSAEDALHALSAFGSWDETRMRRVLDRVNDSAEMQECLEVVISDILIRTQVKMDDIVALCLEYAPVATIEPIDLLLKIAGQFQKCRKVLGIKTTDMESLLKKLQAMEKGLDPDEREERSEEDGACEPQDGPDEKTLMMALTTEERNKVNFLDEMIAKYRTQNQDVEFLIKERDSILRVGA